MVKFCKNCGTLMMPTKDKDGVQLLCRKCETTEKSTDDIVLKSKISQEDRTATVVITDSDDYSTEEMECPSCNVMRKVTQWQVQTRSADEAPTTFYKCKTCQHTWRDYGG